MVGKEPEQEYGKVLKSDSSEEEVSSRLNRGVDGDGVSQNYVMGSREVNQENDGWPISDPSVEEVTSGFLNGVVDDDGVSGNASHHVPTNSAWSMYETPQDEHVRNYVPVSSDGLSQFDFNLHRPGNNNSYQSLLNIHDIVDEGWALGNAAAAVAAGTGIRNSQVERNIGSIGAHLPGGLQMTEPGEEAHEDDGPWHWLRRNQITNGVSVPASRHSPNPIPTAASATLSRHSTIAGERGLGSLQMHRADGQSNASMMYRPSMIGNQFINTDAPVISSEKNGGQPLMAYNGRDSTQTKRPKLLNENFLALGNEGNGKTRSEYNVSSKDCDQSTNTIVPPMIDSSSDQNSARSSLNPNSNAASGFSNFQDSDGGFSRLARNVILDRAQYGALFSSLGQNADGLSYYTRNIMQMPNAGGFPGSEQNAGGVSHHSRNIARMPNVAAGIPSSGHNAGGISHHARNIARKPNVSVGFPRRIRNVGVFPQQAENINRSANLLQGVGGAFQSPKNESGQHWQIPSSGHNANINSNPQGCPTNSSMLNISNQVGRPSPQSIGAMRLPMLPPSAPSIGAMRLSVPPSAPSNGVMRLPVPHSAPSNGAMRLPVPPSSVNPLTGTVRNVSPHSSAISFIKNRAWQNLSGQHTPARVLSASQAATLPGNIGVRPTNQEIPAVNPPTRLFSVSPRSNGSNRKRPAPTFQLDSAPGVNSTKSKLIKLSSQEPALPVRYRKALSPDVPDNVSRVWAPQIYSNSPSLPLHFHIRAEPEDTFPELSGCKCYLCKRDLSFPPEGRIIRPEEPLSAAVLPCGHCFHDSCLEKITPNNQKHDPPCIPCAVGEKENLDRDY